MRKKIKFRMDLSQNDMELADDILNFIYNCEGIEDDENCEKNEDKNKGMANATSNQHTSNKNNQMEDRVNYCHGSSDSLPVASTSGATSNINVQGHLLEGSSSPNFSKTSFPPKKSQTIEKHDSIKKYDIVKENEQQSSEAIKYIIEGEEQTISIQDFIKQEMEDTVSSTERTEQFKRYHIKKESDYKMKSQQIMSQLIGNTTLISDEKENEVKRNNQQSSKRTEQNITMGNEQIMYNTKGNPNVQHYHQHSDSSYNNNFQHPSIYYQRDGNINQPNSTPLEETRREPNFVNTPYKTDYMNTAKINLPQPTIMTKSQPIMKPSQFYEWGNNKNNYTTNHSYELGINTNNCATGQLHKLGINKNNCAINKLKRLATNTNDNPTNRFCDLGTNTNYHANNQHNELRMNSNDCATNHLYNWGMNTNSCAINQLNGLATNTNDHPTNQLSDLGINTNGATDNHLNDFGMNTNDCSTSQLYEWEINTNSCEINQSNGLTANTNDPTENQFNASDMNKNDCATNQGYDLGINANDGTSQLHELEINKNDCSPNQLFKLHINTNDSATYQYYKLKINAENGTIYNQSTNTENITNCTTRSERSKGEITNNARSFINQEMGLHPTESLKRTQEHISTIKDQEYSKKIMLQTNQTANTKIIRYEDKKFFTEIHTTEKLQLSCSKTTVHKYQQQSAIEKIDNSLGSDSYHQPGIYNRENITYQKMGQTPNDLSNWNNREEINITSPLEGEESFNTIPPTDEPLASMTMGKSNTVCQETLHPNYSFQSNGGHDITIANQSPHNIYSKNESLNIVPESSVRYPLLDSSTSTIKYKIIKGQKPYSDVVCYQIGDTFHYKLIWDFIKRDIETKVDQPKLDNVTNTRNEYNLDSTNLSNQPIQGSVGNINEENIISREQINHSMVLVNNDSGINCSQESYRNADNAHHNYNNFTGEFYNKNGLNQDGSQNINETSYMSQSECNQQNASMNITPIKTNFNTQNNYSNNNLNWDMNGTVLNNEPNNYQYSMNQFSSDQSSYMDDI